MLLDQNFSVPVIDVHQGNLKCIWPGLVCAIKNASFVAIDCELSGLGTRKLINSQAVDERYKNISEVSKTRSIISIGLSCFRLEEDESDMETTHAKLNYQVHTFNLMALCSEDYIVEPSALQFLVQHGFDFQKQYSRGIPYYRGSDKKEIKKTSWNLRDMFAILVASKAPLVLHNGLVDLIFLYQNLYADLPSNLSTFVADVEMMFPNGIFDTKYIAEFASRMSASFLEFVFRKEQLRNMNRKAQNKAHVILNHSLKDSEFIDSWDCTPRLNADDGVEICVTYTSHGFCPKSTACQKSHDVFRAVYLEDKKKAKKRKLKDTDNILIPDAEPSQNDDPSRHEGFKGHRAGHDAFMTAFAFSSYVCQKYSESKGTASKCLKGVLADVRNRICLSGKNFPLLIQKSDFAKNSKAHLEKFGRISAECVERQ